MPKYKASRVISNVPATVSTQQKYVQYSYISYGKNVNCYRKQHECKCQ